MKTKKWLVLAVAVLCMVCAAGCGKGAESEGSDTAATLQKTIGGTEKGGNTLSETDSPSSKELSGQKDSNSTAELPEGYVYDYQASLEPIPQEIADLGGPCVGTMHAFPSRIMVGLMKQQMEEDPKFKAEAEQKTEEVRKALEEEIGGEFEVEPMEVDKFGWDFLCREIGTDYMFNISYTTIINVSEYYRDIDVQRCEEDMLNIISEVYDSNCQRFFMDNELNILDIWIADFEEEDIDYGEEQGKILELWKRLREYNESLHYGIHIKFYPKECEEVVCQKYKEGTIMDLNFGPSESVNVLKMKGEIKDGFFYNDIFHGREGMLNIDKLLEEYENGTYDETQKWEYWIGGNN